MQQRQEIISKQQQRLNSKNFNNNLMLNTNSMLKVFTSTNEQLNAQQDLTVNNIQ